MSTLVKLLVTLFFHQTASKTACNFDAAHLGGIRLNVSTPKEHNEVNFSLICSSKNSNDVQNLTLCPSFAHYPSMQFCVTEASDPNCSHWHVDCFNMTSSNQSEHLVRIRTLRFGVYCFLVGFRNAASSVDRVQSLNVFSRDPHKEDSEGSDTFVTLTQIGLGVLNVIVGFSIDVGALRKSLNQFLMDTLTLRLLDPYILFGLGAWKVGLAGQLLVRPVLATLVGLALFPESGDCSLATSLVRAGLLVLATAPIATSALYFTLLFRGDINLMVLQGFVSMALAPLSMLFWWRTLGTHMQLEALSLPLTQMAISFSITFAPISVGIILAWVFPEAMSVSKERFGRPVLAVGLVSYLTTVYFTHMTLYWGVLTWRHVLAAILLAVSVMGVVAAISASIGLSTSSIVTLMLLTGLPGGPITLAALREGLPAPEHQVAATIPQAFRFFVNGLLLAAFVFWSLYCLLNTLQEFVLHRKKKLSEVQETDKVAVIGMFDSLNEVQEPAELKSLWLQKKQIEPLWI